MTAWGKPGWDGKHVNFYTRVSRPCSTGQIFGYNNDLREVRSGLPGKQNWNNRFSSLVMRKGCKVALFAQPDFDGNDTGWIGTTKRLGRVPDPGDNWNNAASSLQFSGSYGR